MEERRGGGGRLWIELVHNAVFSCDAIYTYVSSLDILFLSEELGFASCVSDET